MGIKNSLHRDVRESIFFIGEYHNYICTNLNLVITFDHECRQQILIILARTVTYSLIDIADIFIRNYRYYRCFNLWLNHYHIEITGAIKKDARLFVMCQ